MQIAGTEQVGVERGASGGPGRVTVVGPTLALDLDWTGHAAWKDGLREAHPVLGRIEEDQPELFERVRTFWGDGCRSLPEFSLLAHQAGALEVTEPARLFAEVAAAVTAVPPELRLSSETPEDRAAIRERLAILRADDRRRADYFALLGDLWAPVDAWWQAEGVPTAAAATAQIRRATEHGLPWTELLPEDCQAASELLPQMVELHQAGAPVVIGVCALAGKLLYLDLPGCVLVGLGPRRSEALSRVRTEQVARRIRVLADPTRLALLDHLAQGPSSVGDLARAFGLAQPTVSAHVKQLREAGLVTASRRGPRLELSADRAAVAGLAGELVALVEVD